ncbi:unnamed protein product [Calypogeia fissa]
MADILSVPREFDTILGGPIEPGQLHTYGEKRSIARPPLGPFTHHAVQTFAKTCSEGRIGLNWPDHLLCARETWRKLSPEELSLLHQAAGIDKQRYEDRVQLVGREGAEELLNLLEQKIIQANGAFPSAFDLFKKSPETRSKLYDAKEGSIAYNEFYEDKVFIWLWDRIEDDEKNHWRQEAQQRLQTRNNDRKMKGETELVLDTEPQPREETSSPGKRKRLGSKSATFGEENGNGNLEEGHYDDVDEAEDDNDDAHDEKPDEDDGGNGGINDHAENPPSKDGELDSVEDVLKWEPTEDENLTPKEKQLLESLPQNLHRWDHTPRAARNAYTLYYADRLTTTGSPHLGKDPHCSTTRAEIHASWESGDNETHQHFKNLAEVDRTEFKRQQEEYTEWQRAWWDLKHRKLLHKVIDRWNPNSSFSAGQHRIPADIPRQQQHHHQHQQTEEPPPPSAIDIDKDFALKCTFYPVIRTDYSNDAVYSHLRHVLLNSTYAGDSVEIDMTFYDGMETPSPTSTDMPPFAHDDPRATNYSWCETHFSNKSVDELKASYGELYFHHKEHIPIYTIGGHSYAIVVDSQSMKDGTIKFISMSEYNFVDIRPDGHESQRGGTWEQDPTKEWYLAPRVQAADVVIQLVNLDIANMGWDEFIEHRDEQRVDLFSDPEAQRWRGWQWAVEYVFGAQALEHLFGEVETIPDEACLPEEDD